MKRTGALLLASCLLGSSSFALTTSRSDVNDARASGERLTKTQRAMLQSKVILAQIVRADIHWRQGLVDMFGLDHRVTPGAIFLGAGTVGAEVLAGGMATTALANARFGDYDRAIDAQYKAFAEQDDTLKRLQAEAATLRAEGGVTTPAAALEAAPGEPQAILPAESPAAVSKATKSQRLIELEDQITKSQAALRTLHEAKSQIVRDGKILPKAGRFVRLSLGAVILPLTIYEGVATAYQISYDPQHVDQIEQQLTDFIDDARVTLDNQ